MYKRQFIANGSTQDVYVPTFNASHADTQVIAAGNKIQLKFSENIAALASTSTVKDQFAVLVNGSSATVDSIALNGSDASIVELTLAAASKIAANASVEVAYTQSTSVTSDRLTDAGGNTKLLASFVTTGIENNSSQDLTAPTFLASDAATTVATSGTSIALKFSEALAAITDAQAERDQFTLKVNGVSKTITGISRTSDVVTLTVGAADKIGSTDSVCLLYTSPSPRD